MRDVNEKIIKSRITVGQMYRVIVSPVWPQLHPLKPVSQSDTRDWPLVTVGDWRRGKWFGFEIFSIASSALGVIHCFPGSRRLCMCVCVCWCAAVVYGDHDRPSCELPPTQSYLSHKNTHIKAKIEAKRLKTFLFSSLKVVCPHHQSKYFMCILKAM